MHQATLMEQNTMSKQLKDKVCIVTGGTRGIGKAIAECFAAEGAKVIVTGRSAENTVAVQINSAIQPIHQVQYQACDMNDKKAINALVDWVIKEHAAIDVLVNNAGITKDNLYLRMKEEEWTEVLDTNLNAVFHLTQPVIKQMSKQRSGSIINMSSVVGLHGNPAQVNYCTTKAGIIGFTKALAKEYGRRGIRVNAIAPGFISTEMTDKLATEIQNKYKENIPLGEFGSTKDVAELALFLAASANYISGQVIQVDGGLFM
jgi:3-oxoacyl-[acyl-carrier protein] reductase